MIQLSQISKTFNKGRSNQVNAVNGINLNISAGEFVVIVGSNGSGKSTLLNLIAGSIYADTGSINIDDNDVTKLPDYKRSKWIARVFQNPLSGTAPDLSIIDNFRLAAIRTKPKGLSIGIDEKFKQKVREQIAALNMGLETKLDQPMGTLSGGQRQALTLLMSVTDTCKILLLDEPTAALDPRSADMVMRTADNLIKQFGLTAILITHNLKDAYNYGTRLIQMSEGAVIHNLNTDEKLQITQNVLFEWFS
ncbi:ATP-binding cassette domain-containing protein [Mucilaginibacter limnophilus]|uniref:ATP-binding cassette domain-containing protein n=1 Tax=Mucilaginibacter limnophilus TaxID=1932778 RepID=A0A3S2Y0I5_9SPHI|nr:ATP-binding cassette domain-containing protein [Mucilaginibacter limnophilus]RVU00611.1 ATP-binding cassette domain-containing protein [Mucilaginibacter limnophilus]